MSRSPPQSRAGAVSVRDVGSQQRVGQWRLRRDEYGPGVAAGWGGGPVQGKLGVRWLGDGDISVAPIAAQLAQDPGSRRARASHGRIGLVGGGALLDQRNLLGPAGAQARFQ